MSTILKINHKGTWRGTKQVNRFITDYKYNGDVVFCIEHIPSGYKAIIDNSEEVISRVKNEIITRRVSLTPRVAGDGELLQLRFDKSGFGASSVSLATVVYSQKKDIPIAELKGSQVRHIGTSKTSNVEDCRIANLYCTASLSLDTPSRRITISKDKKYINMLLKQHNTTEYFTYDDELLKIIGTPDICSVFMNTGRPRAQFNRIFKPHLSRIAFNCYHGRITSKNYNEAVSDIQDEYAKDDLTIEHLNGNVHDNRRYNLALVKRGLNSAKNDIIKYITYPYICCIVLDNDEKYRVAIGLCEPLEIFQHGKLLLLDSFSDVVNLLKLFKKLHPEMFNKLPENPVYPLRECVAYEALVSMPQEKLTTLDDLSGDV